VSGFRCQGVGPKGSKMVFRVAPSRLRRSWNSTLTSAQTTFIGWPFKEIAEILRPDRSGLRMTGARASSRNITPGTWHLAPDT
jgi:hypothetical protein